MRVSHIKVQQAAILTINSKKTPQQIDRQLSYRGNSNINQISVFNSVLNLHELPEMSSNIQMLVFRKTVIANQITGCIVGVNLKSIQLPNCCLSVVPRIESKGLTKLNLSHNHIKQLIEIPNVETLKILDMRDNNLTKITDQIFYSPKLNFFHEFIPYQLLKSQKQCNFSEHFDLLNMQQILSDSIFDWSSQKLIQICEQAIQNNNELMMQQLLHYLNDDFIRMIFELSILKRKHKILDLLIRQHMVKDVTHEERVKLLIPSMLPFQILRIASFEMIVKSISNASIDEGKVLIFLSHLAQMSEKDNIFIDSQKDLINFMEFSQKYPHNYEAQFIMTQHNFFKTYEFDNKAIINYFLQLDNLPLVKELLLSSKFEEMVFGIETFKNIVRPNRKLYKMLHKARKHYFEQSFSSNNLRLYLEYRERRTFCIKNDLYDYQILQEYEEMQCSYLKKDFKFTMKFYNKQNEISIAKKIGNELKKHALKDIQHHSRHLSSCSVVNQ